MLLEDGPIPVWNPAEQNDWDAMDKTLNAKVLAMKIIRHIGDGVTETGRPLEFVSSIWKTIDAPSDEFANALMIDMIKRGLITTEFMPREVRGARFYRVNLSLDGWEQYEAEKRGEFEGNYGFLAMEFGDDQLDGFVREVVKPAILEHLGLQLLDMRDAARAGVIDDIMRIMIRDSKFVVADLTHDNNGAYWEAGYAEGLGKPVIYICEESKFKQKQPHFDVNHCTTVMWSADDTDAFRRELIAVLRRSLNL